MAKLPIYNIKGEKAGEADLLPSFFELQPVQDVIHQVVVAERSNARNVVAHTKTRGEVRGGGRKPWRQKGTGNARAGSIRSPIWKGGGVVFGPRPNRNFKKKVNRSQFRKALFMTLSDKLARKKIAILDKISVEKIKTKELAKMLADFFEKIKFSGISHLIVIPKKDKKLELSARNLQNIRIVKVAELSPYQVLLSDRMIFLEPALEAFQMIYNKQK